MAIVTPASPDCGKSLMISRIASEASSLICVITPDSFTANQLAQEFKFFSTWPVWVFPDWETLPYDLFSPHRDIISKRMTLLSQLPHFEKGVFIAPISTFMSPVPPQEYIAQHSLVFTVKQTIDLESFRESLIQSGYRVVTQVVEHGECSFRGSIIDLYPMGSDMPYRIDLFDNEIDSIRTFDPDTQRSFGAIHSINLLPAYEFSFSEDSIHRFRESWREKFSGNPSNSDLYQSVTKGFYSAGLEYYLPLFFEKVANLFHYLPKNTLVFDYEGTAGAADRFWKEIQERYAQLNHDIERPILQPDELFLSPKTVTTSLDAFEKVHGQIEAIPIPDLTVLPQSQEPLKKLQDYLSALKDVPVLFCSESLGRREHVLALLKTIHLTPKMITSWQEFLPTDPIPYLVIAPLQSGMMNASPPFCIITETELFGQRTPQAYRTKKKTFEQNSDLAIRSLIELKIGDPLVHIDHGVGRFLGLKTLTINEIVDEYLTIQYANEDKLYVPVSSLHLIHRYSGANMETAPLHHLGTDQWEKTKRKAQEKIRDTAAELLHLYAKRASQKGFVFKKSDAHYLTFEDGFPFEETPDQLKTIQDVIQDMCSDKTMDRLICGDVGFGKTEVAMRAAFLAVQNKKQVALLSPTTLLAQQHFETFKDRFADYPVMIEMLSRFRSHREQQIILEQLKAGEIDIIIGTHKLLQAGIHFDELGLLIIDEEHRFGVRQKEQLKKIRAEVDILALTATPIPRTLNMALASLRDLSIIATPPINRLSIKTFISEKHDRIIREAMLREIFRGGQVFYLHNDVASMERVLAHLEKLVPEAKIRIAHGQMRERDLERVMADFYHHRFNVLLCSTIIESGIDIPSANTIIIERADKFGLAQLHQLRGRVGRSSHQAYAYLLIPPKPMLTHDAIKRLEAIEASDELGIGFTLATYDLEIRGAGELLGEEQSGQIEEMGFTLYMEMLERTVKALKQGKLTKDEMLFDAPIEINFSASSIIPENYLPDIHTRLVLYKRIANAKSSDELTDLRVEMIDRFGLLPPSVQHLFAIAELRLLAEKVKIKKIDASTALVKITFAEKNQIDPEKILRLIQQQSDQYQLKGSYCLQCRLSLEANPIERIHAIAELIQTWML